MQSIEDLTAKRLIVQGVEYRYKQIGLIGSTLVLLNKCKSTLIHIDGREMKVRSIEKVRNKDTIDRVIQYIIETDSYQDLVMSVDVYRHPQIHEYLSFALLTVDDDLSLDKFPLYTQPNRMSLLNYRSDAYKTKNFQLFKQTFQPKGEYNRVELLNCLMGNKFGTQHQYIC